MPDVVPSRNENQAISTTYANQPSKSGLKLIYWDGTGLVMVYKRLEEQGFVWPAIRDGAMTLNHAQFEALFAGLDWRRVRALSVRAPAEAE